MRRIDALRAVVEVTADAPVVAMCAATSRELAAIEDRDNHFYLLDSMGLTASVGTGLALALQHSAVDQTVVLDGDGSLFMNLNALATIGYYQPPKLVLCVLDNRVYASTGGFPTYSARLDLLAIASACGIDTQRVDNSASLQQALKAARNRRNPLVLHLPIESGNESNIPLLLTDPVVLKDRFLSWLTAATSRSTADPGG